MINFFTKLSQPTAEYGFYRFTIDVDKFFPGVTQITLRHPNIDPARDEFLHVHNFFCVHSILFVLKKSVQNVICTNVKCISPAAF